MGTFRTDLVVDDTVLLELNTSPQLEPSDAAQTLNALRATGLQVGLVLNLGPRPGIRRLIATGRQCRGPHDNNHDAIPRGSAADARSSA